MAETEAEALEQKSGIERWEDFPEVSAKLADGTTLPEWDDKCLVYHAGFEDVTLKAARERCGNTHTPEQPE
jgi:hypothetical protein